MKIKLPKTTRKNFDKYLIEQRVENIDVVNLIDDYFKQRRGYVFRFPKPGESVILMVSGGIDSTVAWAVLMEVFGLKVYPVITYRGQKLRAIRELMALSKISSIYKKRYPDLYVKPFHLKVNSVPSNLIKYNSRKYAHPIDILNNYERDDKLLSNNSNVEISVTSGVGPYMLPLYGVTYSQLLYRVKRLDIKNIFVGINSTDRFAVSSQTFTAIRTTLLSMCTATNNYDWNFASLFMEREMGRLLSKTDVIKLGDKLNVPMKHCWSCYRSELFQCGNSCATCIDRQNAFRYAGVYDETIYMTNIKQKIVNKVLRTVGFH